MIHTNSTCLNPVITCTYTQSSAICDGSDIEARHRRIAEIIRNDIAVQRQHPLDLDVTSMGCFDNTAGSVNIPGQALCCAGISDIPSTSSPTNSVGHVSLTPDDHAAHSTISSPHLEPKALAKVVHDER